MIVNSVPYAAPAYDAIVGIKLALQLEAIDSCLKKFRGPQAVAFPHLKLKRRARQLHTAGLAIHLPIAPHIETHLQMEVPQPSPRNKMSRIPPAVQLEIFNAAEAKRKRKELQRAIDAGSGEDLL